MFFPDSGRGERQNEHYLFSREHVNAPFNCGAVDLAGPAFAEMWHAIMGVRGPFVRRLDVLNIDVKAGARHKLIVSFFKILPPGLK